MNKYLTKINKIYKKNKILFFFIIFIIIFIITFLLFINYKKEYFENNNSIKNKYIEFNNKNRKQDNGKIALVLIAKFEDKYIDEFINYYLVLGIDKIFIYDNSDDNSLKKYDSEMVKIIHFPGEVKQMPAYNDFFLNYSEDFEWVCFFDTDEFLVLKKHENIKDFINDYNECDAIGINWRIFGSNGKKEYENLPVTQRFTKCEKEPNKHVKSIIRCDRAVLPMKNPHYSETKNNNTCNLNKKKFNGPFNEDYNIDIAELHHYIIKSYNEYLEKIKRGRSDTKIKRKIEGFYESDKNDIFNDLAWQFYKNNFLNKNNNND